MKPQYAIVYTKFNSRTGQYIDIVVARRRTLHAAIVAADRCAASKDGMRQTMYGRRKRDSVQVIDTRRDGLWNSRCVVYEHPGFIIPSVGEVGYW